jgi:hypothetical protein
MKRTVDRTKKSNIKCEHCKYYTRNEYSRCVHPSKTGTFMNYWQRCKMFEWRELNI